MQNLPHVICSPGRTLSFEQLRYKKGADMSQERADDQRKAMLRAIHEREGRWGSVDPNTEIATIGSAVGLSEDESFALFKQLVDGHYVDPGRVLQAGHAIRRGASQVVGREGALTPVSRDMRITDKGRAELA
jgi:hypothetical protein